MPGAGGFIVEPLDPKIHRREEFRCESLELAEFLQKRARQEMDRQVSACFIMAPVEDAGKIAGFYTLSSTSVALQDLGQDLARKLPRYPLLPATLLGRLARDLRFRGQGLGDLLMVSALSRALKATAEVGSMAVIADAKDERAFAFYRAFGFQPLKERRLFLPMSAVPRTLAGCKTIAP